MHINFMVKKEKIHPHPIWLILFKWLPETSILLFRPHYYLVDEEIPKIISGVMAPLKVFYRLPSISTLK